MQRMLEQLSLAGVDNAPTYTDRLFFAIFPDPAVAKRVASLALQQRFAHGLRGRPLDLSRFHVTLHHIGDYEGPPPLDIVDKACAVAASIAASPFDAGFDRVMSFGRKARANPFVLRADANVAAVMAFQKAVVTAINRSPFGRPAERVFTPHMTLLYDERSVPPQPVETIHWTVREFVLVHSLLGRTVHKHLGRWPLLG